MIEMPWKIISLQTVSGTLEKPGDLTIAELANIAPGFFPGDAAPRVYWIANGGRAWSVRGGHYHPEGGKRELIVAMLGEIEFELHSVGGCGHAKLTESSQGLLIPGGVWHGVRISPGGALLSIASTLYAPGESVIEKPCACPTP